MKYKWIILILALMAIIVLSKTSNNFVFPSDISHSYYQEGDKKNSADKLFMDVLDQYEYIKTTSINHNWALFIPKTYKYSNMQLMHLKSQICSKNQVVGLVLNSHFLGSKQQLWLNLVKYFGREMAKQLHPESWILPDDNQLFIQHFKNNRSSDSPKLYILKSEAHRQEGLKLTDNLQEILGSEGTKYKLIQEYQDDPFLFQGHKLNLRVYVLVTVINNYCSVYIYQDGIVSYSPELFKKYNYLSRQIPETDQTICSFYKSKPLYGRDFPVTMSQLSKKISHYSYTKLWNRCQDMITQVIKVIKPNFQSLTPGNKYYQLYGVDFAIDANLTPTILEFNMGPGMSPATKYDYKLRYDLWQNVLEILQLIPSKNYPSLSGKFKRVI